MEFLSGREESDLVIMLISGGGSTLLCLPEAPMTCTDESLLFEELTAKGATIQDINTCASISRRRAAAGSRRGVSGRGRRRSSSLTCRGMTSPPSPPARRCLTPQPSTTREHVLAKYGIDVRSDCSSSKRRRKQKYFERVTNILFPHQSRRALRDGERGAARGYAADIADDHFSGEAREIGRADR